MSELKLAAATRTEFGKGAARRIRRANQIPAVLYSHGSDPIHITLPGHQTMLALKHANALFTIAVEGSKDRLAIAKDVQRDPVKNIIEHIDLLEVVRGEIVSVEVNVHLVGEAAPGAVPSVETQSVTLEADATALPESIEVSVEGLEAGTQVRASDLVLPAGATYSGDLDAVIVAISGETTGAELEAIEEEAAEAAAEAEAEGETAEEGASDEAAAEGDDAES